MTDTYLEDFATRLKPRQASNILLWAIIAFFVIFIAWAALTELDRTVHAQGRVIPSSRLQVVSNLEGGIIREILVKSGDMVTKGQPRSEEHTSELQSLMRISYAVFCLKKKKLQNTTYTQQR